MMHTLLDLWRGRSSRHIDHDVVQHRSDRDEAMNEIDWAVRRWV